MKAERGVWWLVAAIGLFTTILHAERLFAEPITLPYCQNRAALALDIARTVQGGLPMDKINVEYLVPSQSTQEAADRKAWVNELFDEISTLMVAHGEPEMVAQKVMERCAYAYGAQRRTATEQNTKEYCWYRVRTLADLFDVAREVGSVEAMLAKYPPPAELTIEAATGMVQDILDAKSKGEYLQTEWLKCTGGQI